MNDLVAVFLTPAQVQNLMGLVDNGVRYAGLKACIPAGELAVIFENAMIEYNSRQSKQTKDKDIKDENVAQLANGVS